MVVFTINHVITDGMGVNAMIAYMADQFDPKFIPAMRKLQFIDHLFFLLKLPYLTYLYLKLIAMTKRADPDQPMISKDPIGKQTCVESKSYSFSDLRVYKQFKGQTFNTFMTTIFSKSLSDIY